MWLGDRSKCSNMDCTTCKRPARYVYSGNPCCGIHLRTQIRTEPCAICLDNMAHGEVTQLECGHILHTHCLSHCMTAACPLCRHGFGSVIGPQIQHNTRVRPLMEMVYGLVDPVDVRHVFAMFNDVSIFYYMITSTVAKTSMTLDDC